MRRRKSRDEMSLDDTRRRKATRVGSCGNIESMITTSAASTTSRRTTRRDVSRIPVRTDRLHPTTTNHVDHTPRRHSLYAMPSRQSIPNMSDLSHDPVEESLAECFNGGEQTKRPASKAGLTTSCSEHSLTDARKRVLARLAGCQSQPSDSEEIGCSRALPRKLDPIFSRRPTYIYDDDDVDDDDDDKRVLFTCG